MQFLKAFLNNHGGASAVEFALIAPLLLYILAGTVDYGFFVKERMELLNTAQAAADYVAQTQNDANVSTVAQEAYTGDFSNITVTSEFACECADGVAQTCPAACGDDDYQRRFVNVTTAGSFDPIMLYPGLPQQMDLQTTVRMRVD